MKSILLVLSILFCGVVLSIVRELIDIVQGTKILITLLVIALGVWIAYALATKKGPQIDKY